MKRPALDTPPAYLPFEGPVQRLDEQLRKLHELSRTNAMDLAEEVAQLQIRRKELLERLYAGLSPWERVQVARHPQRPQTRDYLERMCSDFLELHGDRAFADDRAVVTGFARLGGERVMIVGQHKGRDVAERSECNFGSPQPEGYRKALWKMRLAEKYRLPILTLIDTKGAAPDVAAEERGQSQALAANLMAMSALRVPILSVVIGEGGSGGALALGAGDRLLIQEYAYFSVISPEGCASILWRDGEKRSEAAAALKLSAPDLLALGLVDEVVREPLGGAHRDPAAAAKLLKEALLSRLAELERLAVDELLAARYRRLRSFGRFMQQPEAAASTPAPP
jgi:acetyl-CoA carboxylase carboxyl transferase subunit alpha